ncbi:immunoglobulin domain-containing protein [Nibricoccus sp. IMCC34717]|uniref:immunoglobulin domain-containing protein n=1 Tax=Nibricoccus sp. IMCC34717 TaxID=3034021 RepID=UPI00384D0564
MLRFTHPFLLGAWLALGSAHTLAEGRTALYGQTVTFQVTASGTAPFTYRWFKDSVELPSAREAILKLAAVTEQDTGDYSVEVANAAGAAHSDAVPLHVLSEPESPRPSMADIAMREANLGERVTLDPKLLGRAPESIRWFKDGTEIPNATNPTLALGPVDWESTGLYSIEVTLLGTKRSFVVFALRLVANYDLRISALSIRARVDDEPLIAGVAVDPAISTPLLFRAAGPSLARFGVGDPMFDPVMAIYDGPMKVAGNNDWGTTPFGSNLAEVFGLAGAFPFNGPASKDAALVEEVSGNRTAVLTSADGGGGTVLFEVYDLLGSDRGPLRNISARGHTPGGGSLVLGFALHGTGSRTLLLRGIGPSLRAFGIPSPLENPQLKLHRIEPDGALLLAVAGPWGGTQVLRDAFAKAGAFPLPIDSSDTAMLAKLSAGSYTLTIESSDGNEGVVLAEACLLP